MPNKLTVGTYLKEIRENKKMSQYELALKLGLNQSRVSRIEQDKGDITFSEVLAYEKVFKMNLKQSLSIILK